jgi:lipoprotein-anchoring transpeptidase ErfK/SrfK
VAEKHGSEATDGMVFVAREPTGERWRDRPDAGPDQKSLVTTRILRLRGLEPGINAGSGIDSFDRYIYIHGTNHPDRFPENISAGCLLMRDDDLIELFEQVPLGTHVWISAP